jgi:hypothetical protein
MGNIVCKTTFPHRSSSVSWGSMKSTRILFCILIFLLSAAAESLHVTAVGWGSRCLRCGPHSVINSYITGIIGDKRYSLVQHIRYDTGDPGLQVGQDYPVVEINDKTVKVSVTDKQGKQQTKTLDVVTVERVN